MKTLYLIRHAKSGWSGFTVSDFERTLNERGNNDAPKMAERLLNKKIKIDAFVSSPAIRARQTCEHFCDVYKSSKKNIIFIDELYHAAPSTIEKNVLNLDDKFDEVAIFSHNPGITEYAGSLIENVCIDNMPTCGIFAVSANIEHWKDFSNEEKTLDRKSTR